MFKLATAVLLLLGVNTPSIAQRCIADTLASRVYDEKTRELTCVLSSGAVYRTLPVVAEGDHTYLTEKDLAHLMHASALSEGRFGRDEFVCSARVGSAEGLDRGRCRRVRGEWIGARGASPPRWLMVQTVAA